MKPSFPPVMAALAILAAPLEAQTLVYSVPGQPNSTYSNLAISKDTEYGSAAGLAGTDRLLQSAGISLYSQTARSVTATLSIYAAIPEDRDFGTSTGTGPLADLRPADVALWSSGSKTFTLHGGGTSGYALNQLLFSNINTLLPDKIFWAITFTDITNPNSGGALGLKLGNASSATPQGATNNPNHLYLRSDGTSDVWLPATISGPGTNNSTLAVSLTAVPEPSSALLVAGFTAFGFIRRRRHA